MKAHQRKIEACRSGGYGHYNFLITYPSGRTKSITNIANAPLYDAVNDLDTGIISVNHSIWKSISYLL
jgi:hypothetical protein